MRQTPNAHKRVLGEEYSRTLICMNGLASLYPKLKRLDEAEALQVPAFDRCKRILGEVHSQTLIDMNALGAIYRELGRSNEAD